ncbi:MAG: tRNA pseudouridine(55) synthase TruB [Agathobacter sp.]|nr:tRNA pseudouridine(55) synthase TruB [Agathobacter sp.]
MINGIINIYKEKGFTSFDVVAKMRGIAHQKKIGHTGTLDPDAEGVLPVCLGKATKVCDLLTDKDKEYEAVLLLGIMTDTQDVTGQVLKEHPVDVNEQQVRETIHSFVGRYEQIPPMFSALKVDGKKLCDLARKGITVERKARPVLIHEIEILSIELPRVRMRVHCSKGTYIRTLCQDIGEKLGCYGCMESLLRTQVAGFMLKDAYRLREVEEIFANGKEKDILFPVDTVFDRYPKCCAVEQAVKLLENGNRIPSSMIPAAPKDEIPIRLYCADGRFVGIYTYQREQEDYKPIKIFME